VADDRIWRRRMTILTSLKPPPYRKRETRNQNPTFRTEGGKKGRRIRESPAGRGI